VIARARKLGRHHPRDPHVTSRLMASVRRKDTAAEMALRQALWKRGMRYRLHDNRLPGTPDIVFPRQRLAVFIDGDYWHGRILIEQGPRALREAFRTENRDFWIAKVARNVERDQRQTQALHELGWLVVRIWERDILCSPDAAARRVRSTLRQRGRSCPAFR
jgi:DNA mismatch endonuclease, patch repair protein